MKVEVLQCPNCNSNIKDENITFCPYCGSKLFVDDGTKRIVINKNIKIVNDITKTKRDETEIIKAELKDRHDKREQKITYTLIICLMLLVAVPFFMMFRAEKEEKTKYIEGLDIQTPAKDYEGRNYEIVVSELEGLGFYNIETKAVPARWLKKEGTVERISINGDYKFKKGTYFRKDASIIITYYIKEE